MSIRIKALVVLFCLLIPLSLTAKWYTDIGDSFEKMRSGVAEIQDSIVQIQEGIATANRFITTVSTVIKTITKIVGVKTIILLILVILISSGFRTLGMSAGLFSFLLSLFLADSLWFIWGKSTQTDLIAYSASILRTNAAILFPVIAYFLIKKYSGNIRNFIKRNLLKNFRSGLSIYESEQLLLLVDHGSHDLIKKIREDIEKSDKGGNLLLSDDSYYSLNKIKKLLAQLDKKV